MLLGNEWVNEIKEKIKSQLEIKHKTTQNLWNTTKAVMRGKIIIQPYT